MTALVRVAVVRPKLTWSDVVVKLVVGLLVTLLTAWVLMLIAGEVTDWGLGYLDTVLVLAAVRLLQVAPNSKTWTHE